LESGGWLFSFPLVAYIAISIVLIVLANLCLWFFWR
jgi:hypothetical protein